MKSEEVIKKSFRVTNKAIFFVLIYYLSTLSLTITRNYKFSIILPLSLLILGLVIRCGIMGAISKIINGGNMDFKSFIESIKIFFFRYLGAILMLCILTIVCFFPSFIFFRVTKGDMAIREFIRTTPSLLMTNLSMLLFTILSIYIFPFVFVKNKGADAFLDGIKYLFKNFKNSTALIIMGIIKIIISTFILAFVAKYPHDSLQYISFISVNSFISIYIELSIFAGACYILGDE